MKAFADLYSALDGTKKTNEKIDALVAYFSESPPESAAWAIFFLSGRKLKAVLPMRRLCSWAIDASAIPQWLFEESYEAVGDLAETIALLLPATTTTTDIAMPELVERLQMLQRSTEDRQRAIIDETWKQLPPGQRFVWNKLITGAFRVGVSQQLVARALAKVSGTNVEVVNHRLMGNWEPTADFYQALIRPDTEDTNISRPYPFCLAYPLAETPESLGDVHDWFAEWKWDGIRAQLIKREGEVYLWSRGEEMINQTYPEIVEAARIVADGTVLDGEILAWQNDCVADFGQLQLRIGRKIVGRSVMQNVPVILMCYDLLEHKGSDIRNWPFSKRRKTLTKLIESLPQENSFLLSPVVASTTWENLIRARLGSRDRNVEGLMLKRLTSPYRGGRQRGDWWKWKIDPYTVDAVLIYAQRGSGRRASLYTDYTFGIWEDGQLVPIAKAYSGLTDAEIQKVDAFVRRNTIDQFGPVHAVKPELVFELGFEGIWRSTRHKSGIAVRFPRILQWRTDKTAKDADTLQTLLALLEREGQSQVS